MKGLPRYLIACYTSRRSTNDRALSINTIPMPSFLLKMRGQNLDQEGFSCTTTSVEMKEDLGIYIVLEMADKCIVDHPLLRVQRIPSLKW